MKMKNVAYVKRKAQMKNLLKNLLVVGVMTCANSLYAVEQDANAIVPLSKYLEKNDAKDPIVTTYVYDRCVSLFLALAIGSKNEKGIEAEKFHTNAQNAYTDVVKAEALLLIKTAKDPDVAQKEHTEAVKRIQKIYSTRMDKVIDLGQDMMNDGVIGGDLNICAEIVKRIRTKQ